ncbi:MAG TPA: ABC transporter permease [Candidatus Binataceae bacterium]
MPFETLIGFRYLRARRRERFVSLIALISMLGVMLGTLALTVVLAVMSGLQEDLRQRLLSFSPEITIVRPGWPSWNASALQARVSSIAGVTGVAPFSTAQVMAIAGGQNGEPGYVSGATMRAVVALHNPVLIDLARSLTAGGLSAIASKHPFEVDDRGTKRTVELPGAIVGRSLADSLGLQVGVPLTIVSPASLGAAAAPRLRRFLIGGFFYSGMAEYDSSLVIVALEDGRAFLAGDEMQESGLEVRVADPFDAPAIAAQIAAIAGPGYEISNWTQNNSSLFMALAQEKLTYFLVLLLIVLVAAFNIVATLVMVVMERRKEIAILQAMGARSRSIASIFLFEGAALGIVGTVLGVGTGYVISYLIGRYHLIRLPPEIFIVSAVPVRLYALNFLTVGFAAIALCLGASLYPALQARSLSPVEVIRYE